MQMVREPTRLDRRHPAWLGPVWSVGDGVGESSDARIPAQWKTPANEKRATGFEPATFSLEG